MFAERDFIAIVENRWISQNYLRFQSGPTPSHLCLQGYQLLMKSN